MRSSKQENEPKDRIASSLFSGSLSMALCYIQRVFRSGHLVPQPRGTDCAIGMYMKYRFYACKVRQMARNSTQNSAFLQQASYITGGVHHKPQQLDGLFQYLSTIFATDLHSQGFVQLPKPMFLPQENYRYGLHICSVCLSIFYEHHMKCTTCGSVFGQSKLDDVSSVSDKKRKSPDT